MGETGWRFKQLGSTITHSWMAVAPGCDLGPHPTRWCDCKIHTTKAKAVEYAKQRKGKSE